MKRFEGIFFFGHNEKNLAVKLAQKTEEGKKSSEAHKAFSSCGKTGEIVEKLFFFKKLVCNQIHSSFLQNEKESNFTHTSNLLGKKKQKVASKDLAVGSFPHAAAAPAARLCCTAARPPGALRAGGSS